MRLSDSEIEEVVRVAIEACLTLGWGCLKDPERLLPFWKKTSLYERGVMIRRDTIRSYAPKWKIRDELRKLATIGGVPPYDRDFFQGLSDACCKLYSNGIYKRLEFCGRPHVRKFLEGGEHGQFFKFAALSSGRGLSRTLNLPLLEVPPAGNLEAWFLGALCGSRAVVLTDGEVMAEVRPECVEKLSRLGVVHDRDGEMALVSPFYIVLFMGELPEAVRSYWVGNLPDHGVQGTRRSSLVASMHWEGMFGRNARQRFKEAFPYLLTTAHCWNVGVDRVLVIQEMKRRRFDHVPDCIAARLNRWYNLQKSEEEEKNGPQESPSRD